MNDFNEYFEEDNEIEIMKNDAYMQEMLYEIKLKLANENYDLIVENGIDVKSMRGNGYNVDAVKRTLNQMLDIFVEVEEYEKCAKIKDVLDLF
jgi:hypothetical protein